MSRSSTTPSAGAARLGGARGRTDARRGRSGRAARWLALALIFLGALALADGTITLLWQEPISALIAKLRQDRLSGELRRAEAAVPDLAERRALAGLADERRRIDLLARDLQAHAHDGSPVGRIVIPRIGADFVVVKGTGTEELESGPGIYPETPFPGTAAATTAIAGHRTTYLAPFRHIDALAPGSRIFLDMPYAHFLYRVVGQRVVSPNDFEAAVANVGYSRLVLSACTPLFSAAKRLLVYARLERTVPEGAARLLVGGVIARPLEARPRPPRRLPPVLESLDPNGVAPLS